MRCDEERWRDTGNALYFGKCVDFQSFTVLRVIVSTGPGVSCGGGGGGECLEIILDFLHRSKTEPQKNVFFN